MNLKTRKLSVLVLVSGLILAAALGAPSARANTASITGPGTCTTLLGKATTCDYTFSFNGNIGGAVYPSIVEWGDTQQASVSANAYACGFRSFVGICTLYLNFAPTHVGTSSIDFVAGPSGSVYWSNVESVNLIAQSPLPAPQAVSFLALGLVGLALTRRRRIAVE